MLSKPTWLRGKTVAGLVEFELAVVAIVRTVISRLVMTSKSNQGLSNGKLNIRMQTGQDRTNKSRPRKLRVKSTGILNGPQECQSGVSSWSRRDTNRHLPDDLPYGTPLIDVATQGDGYTI